MMWGWQGGNQDPISQREEQRLRETQWVAQGHMVRRRQCWGHSPGPQACWCLSDYQGILQAASGQSQDPKPFSLALFFSLQCGNWGWAPDAFLSRILKLIGGKQGGESKSAPAPSGFREHNVLLSRRKTVGEAICGRHCVISCQASSGGRPKSRKPMEAVWCVPRQGKLGMVQQGWHGCWAIRPTWVPQLPPRRQPGKDEGWKRWPVQRMAQTPRDFPGGPVVKTPRFHCKGHGFNPRSGN